MLSGVLTPAFLQSAGRAGKKKENVIRLVCAEVNPKIERIVCVGDIVVKSISGGEEITATYTDIDDTITIQSDINSEIQIIGNVTRFVPNSADEDGTESVINIYIDSTSLLVLNCQENQQLQEISINRADALEQIVISGDVALTSLIMPKCYALIELTGVGEKISLIKYPATNEDVSQTIANAIEDAFEKHGVVYTDANGAYYDIIEDVATATGWTVEQL